MDIWNFFAREEDMCRVASRYAANPEKHNLKDREMCTLSVNFADPKNSASVFDEIDSCTTLHNAGHHNDVSGILYLLSH